MKRRNNWYVSNDKCSELLLSRKTNKTTRSYTIRRMKRIKGFYKRHWELPIEEQDEDLVVIRYVLAIGHYKMGGCFSFKKHSVSTYYKKRLSKIRFNLILKSSSSHKNLSQEAKKDRMRIHNAPNTPFFLCASNNNDVIYVIRFASYREII